jgi:hypothetical protein
MTDRNQKRSNHKYLEVKSDTWKGSICTEAPISASQMGFNSSIQFARLEIIVEK